MPLSEQEQRLLDEMERHLMRNDTDVVTPREGRTISYRNVTIGALLILLGIGALVVGVSTHMIVGIVGFLAMLGGVILAATPAKVDLTDLADTARAPRPQRTSATFMDKMNDRWDRRHEAGDDR